MWGWRTTPAHRSPRHSGAPGRRRTRLALPALGPAGALIAAGVLTASGLASWITPYSHGSFHVPIERLIENVRRDVERDPDSAQGHATLARLHSLAFASKPFTAPAADMTIEAVSPALPDERRLEHLAASIHHYRQAWDRAPRDAEPHYILGLAYTVESGADLAGHLDTPRVLGADVFAEAGEPAARTWKRHAAELYFKAFRRSACEARAAELSDQLRAHRERERAREQAVDAPPVEVTVEIVELPGPEVMQKLEPLPEAPRVVPRGEPLREPPTRPRTPEEIHRELFLLAMCGDPAAEAALQGDAWRERYAGRRSAVVRAMVVTLRQYLDGLDAMHKPAFAEALHGRHELGDERWDRPRGQAISISVQRDELERLRPGLAADAAWALARARQLLAELDATFIRAAMGDVAAGVETGHGRDVIRVLWEMRELLGEVEQTIVRGAETPASTPLRERIRRVHPDALADTTWVAPRLDVVERELARIAAAALPPDPGRLPTFELARPAIVDEFMSRDDRAGWEAIYSYVRLARELGIEASQGERFSHALEICTVADETIQTFPRAITPIIFSLDEARPLADLLAPDRAVFFDLDGDGLIELWPWVEPATRILVWDPDRTGRITSGRQMFGSATWWMLFDDGYEALRALDDDGDGVLAGAELRGLAAWRDADSDGVSDAGEVVPLADLGVRNLATRATGRDGASPMNPRGLVLDDGRALPTIDWVTRPIVVPR